MMTALAEEFAAAAQSVCKTLDRDQMVSCAIDSIRIPSRSYRERELAEFYAETLSDLGFDVSMMDVVDPTDNRRRSIQPVGYLRGRGGGSALMLHGHMDAHQGGEPSAGLYDATVRDGWIQGPGALDNKGGLAAALAAVGAICRADLPLKGDIVFCPVAGGKCGNVGTRQLLAAGITAGSCINIAPSANALVTASVGRVQLRVTTRNTGLFFRYSAEAKAAYYNAIEQQMAVVEWLGPSLEDRKFGGWMTFTPDPDLAGFPNHRFRSIHKDKYPRECEMILEVRTVPGQSAESLREDLDAFLYGLKDHSPTLDAWVDAPDAEPKGLGNLPPMRVAPDHPLVGALSRGHHRASGQRPLIGGGPLVGKAGDANILTASGIPTVRYGPGDPCVISNHTATNERVEVDNLLVTAGALVGAIMEICADPAALAEHSHGEKS